jgi:hypothetical protein
MWSCCWCTPHRLVFDIEIVTQVQLHIETLLMTMTDAVPRCRAPLEILAILICCNNHPRGMSKPR